MKGRAAGSSRRVRGATERAALGPGVARRSRLPAQLDSFVGRRLELAQARRLLSGSRLLTLTGPAGCGKTRLALQLVDGLERRYPDGVWMVELASLKNADLLAQAVASTLEIREQAGQPLPLTIAQELSARRALLLLDNCEHLVEACAAFVELVLRGSVGLHVVVTSREALGVAGEVTYRVPQLSLPEPEDLSRRSTLLASDAVRLFLDRARTCKPDFELMPENGPTIARICQGLDGMPLPIELAARLVDFMSLDELLRRQSDRLDLLAGRRTAPQRHRSLRAAIEWSHELLNEAERAVFRRLSVFVGSFSLDGATAVCAGDDVRPDAILALVSSLAAKSLVTPLGGSGAAWRLRQLESIRLFGLEQLEEAGELEPTRGRLADWAASLAELAAETYMASATAQLLDAEHDNLLQALEWMRQRGDDRLALVAAAVARGWRRHGHLAEGRRLLSTVLASADQPLPYRSAAVHQAFAFAHLHGDYEQALALAREDVEIERRLGRPLNVMRALEYEAIARAQVGDLAGARTQAEECLALARQLNQPYDAARIANNLATTLLQAGDVEAANALVESEAIVAAMRAEGDLAALGFALCTVGEIKTLRGDVADGEAAFKEALRTWSPDPVMVARVIGGLGIGAVRRSQPELALRFLGAAEAVNAEAHGAQDPWWERRVAEAEAAAQGMLSAARAEAALGAGRRLNREQAIELALGTEAPPPGAAPPPLSRRERQVAALVARGLTNREIGAQLGISDRTVESHIEHVRQKLGLGTRAEVAVWAAAEGQG
jgi:predicted ATPase/DNA-binding CsgD family transcriptional regulator